MHCHARQISFGALFGLMLVWSAHAEEKPLSAKDLICNAYGGPFILNDEDFDVLMREELGPNKITREQFASLDVGSKARITICDTRKLWRLIKDSKVTFISTITISGHLTTSPLLKLGKHWTRASRPKRTIGADQVES